MEITKHGEPYSRGDAQDRKPDSNGKDADPSKVEVLLSWLPLKPLEHLTIYPREDQHEL